MAYSSGIYVGVQLYMYLKWLPRAEARHLLFSFNAVTRGTAFEPTAFSLKAQVFLPFLPVEVRVFFLKGILKEAMVSWNDERVFFSELFVHVATLGARRCNCSFPAKQIKQCAHAHYGAQYSERRNWSWADWEMYVHITHKNNGLSSPTNEQHK